MTTRDADAALVVTGLIERGWDPAAALELLEVHAEDLSPLAEWRDPDDYAAALEFYVQVGIYAHKASYHPHLGWFQPITAQDMDRAHDSARRRPRRHRRFR